MNELIGGSVFAPFRKYCLISHILILLLVLSLICFRDSEARGDVENLLLAKGPAQPILCRGDNGPVHDLHHHNRRGSSNDGISQQHEHNDNDTLIHDWNIFTILVNSFTRPAVSLVAALLMMTNVGTAADTRPGARPLSAISLTAPEPDSVFNLNESVDFLRPVPVRTVSEEHRKSSWGNGHIVIADPAEYPRIRAFDVHDSESLWDNMRPNLFGQQITDEWDFYNLINTDRPDFTDATFSAGKGVTIIESGYTSTRNNDPDLHSSRRVLPEVLVRVGVTDEFELRMKWYGYVMTVVTDQATGLKDYSFGGSDLYLGFKYEVRQQDDWVPMVTVLGGSTVPTGTGGVSASAMQPFGNVVIGWGFRRWLYLKASSGVDFLRNTDVTQVILSETQTVNGLNSAAPVGIHGNDSSALWHNSVSLLYQASKRVGGFVEWFNLVSNNSSDNRAQHFTDTGLFIYLTPNTQLDVRVGERISNRVDGLFTGAGFSVRF